MHNRHQLVGPQDLAQMKRDWQIRFLIQQGLKPHHKLLDYGCGTLRGGIPLIEYLDTSRYYGYEIRPEVLREARQELQESGLSDKQPYLGSNVVPTPYDCVWAFSVLFHLDEYNLHEFFLQCNLRLQGVAFANVNIGKNQKIAEWQGFPVWRRPMSYYAYMADLYELELQDMGSLEELGHVSGNEAGDAQRMLKFSRL